MKINLVLHEIIVSAIVKHALREDRIYIFNTIDCTVKIQGKYRIGNSPRSLPFLTLN